MKEIYNKYNKIICISLLLVILVLLGILFTPRVEEDANIVEEVVKEEKTEISDYYVDIKGEVLNPGVYKVDSNMRIIDVIKLAGGLTDNADISLLNLSKKIIDEMNIKIYSKKEVTNAKSKINSPTVIEIIKEIEKECVCIDENDACINDNNETSNLININTATKEELMTLSGIGESKANSIIEYRNNKTFESIEEIKEVSGIGDSVFDKIKDYIEI